VPVDLVRVPVLDEAVHHLETNDFMLERQQIVVSCDVQALELVVEAVLLNAMHVVLPVFFLLGLRFVGFGRAEGGRHHQAGFLLQSCIRHHEKLVGDN